MRSDNIYPDMNVLFIKINGLLSLFRGGKFQFSSSISSVIACRIEYSLDGGLTWNTLIPNTFAEPVACQNSASSYVAITATAKTQEVMIRAIIVGNNSSDPRINYVAIDIY